MNLHMCVEFLNFVGCADLHVHVQFLNFVECREIFLSNEQAARGLAAAIDLPVTFDP